MKVCVVGASGKLGTYMVRHCLDRGYEVVGVCRPESVGKLDEFDGRITVIPGRTNDPDVIRGAVAGCDGVLTVLVPWGVEGYSSGTAQAVLDHAAPDARLVFSCGWHITRDGKDRYSWKLKWLVPILGRLARLFRVVDLDDQVEACRRIFASDRRWTVVRGSDLEEGESQGLPVWSRHVGDPILASNLTRRVDFALFMVDALTNDALVREAPAIVGCRAPSALVHAGEGSGRTASTAGRETMTGSAGRVDEASRTIRASPSVLYQAFADPAAMESWLPPTGMTGRVERFDFRDGGSYRMRLTYEDPSRGSGKSSEGSDEVEVCFLRLVPNRLIEQAVTFDSDDPRFSGVMKMTWTFTPAEAGTVVSVRCENVPEGISAEDHAVGLRSTLENLGKYLE